MDWIILVISILGFLALGFLMKYLFPSYMTENGKNLATKEDIAEITRKTEEVQEEFKKNIELFSSDIQFKYEYYYKQYSALYSNLYSFIVQSEYVRRYISLTKKEDISFEEVPFFEITPIHKTTTIYTNGKIQKTSEERPTSISNFNKVNLCEYIIEKGELASQELLKIAISYRFAHQRSGDENAQTEELNLLSKMVECIIIDYNNLRKLLNLTYNSEEIKNGRIIL